MFTQSDTQLVQWQDFKVRNEVDIVLEMAQQKGWNDCEIFGHGSMITQPQESMGWKLIPADLYEYSIPAEGVSRVHQIINAGIRIQGVIIADDEKRTEPPPIPVKPKTSLPSAEAMLSFISKALLVLMMAAGAIALVIAAWPLIIVGAIVGILGSIFGSTNWEYDPKLVILVDDGNGGTAWISILTWYD